MNTEIRKSTCVPKIHYALPDNLKRLKRNPANLQVNTVHLEEEAEVKGLWLHHLRKSIRFAKFAVKNLTLSRELWLRNPGGVRIALDAKFATKYLGKSYLFFDAGPQNSGNQNKNLTRARQI